MPFDPGEHLVGHQRGRAVRAHAAGVRSGVAVERRLVVLGWLKRDDGLAVGDRQHAGFLAVEPLFDNDAIACGAEYLVAGDLADGLEGLFAG